MIRHIVLVAFRDDPGAAAIRRAIDAILELKKHIDGIIAITAGANISTEALEQGFRYGFVIDFTDAAARDAYLVHPANVAAGKGLVTVAAGGIAGILVFDYAI